MNISTNKVLDLKTRFSNDIVIIILICAIPTIAFLIIKPVANVPIIDDWIYAWSVEHLIQTGKLRFLDYTTAYPFLQIIWGSIFAKIFGFSFYTLKISTFVLYIMGLVAFYITLRVLNVQRLLAFLGTLFLAFNPVVFYLSYTFMTEIPFFCLMNFCILFYVLWIDKKNFYFLIIGNVIAVGCFFSRQIGIFLLFLPLIYIFILMLRDREVRIFRLEFILILFSILIAALIYFYASHELSFTTKQEKWIQFFLKSWNIYLQKIVEILFYLSFYFFPLTVFYLRGCPKRSYIMVSIVVFLLVVVFYILYGSVPNPLHHWNIMSPDEIGISRKLIYPGRQSIKSIPPIIQYAISFISVISLISLITYCLEYIKRKINNPGSSDLLIFINIFVQLLVVTLFLHHHDRYYISVIPSLIIFLILFINTQKYLVRLIMLSIIIFASISVTGTLDAFSFLREVSSMREYLVSIEKINPYKIDAGYSMNGWWFYAHPENLPEGADRKRHVPFVTGKYKFPFVISNNLIDDYEIFKINHIKSIWSATDKIYLLKKIDLKPTLTIIHMNIDDKYYLEWGTGDGSQGEVYIVSDSKKKLFDRGPFGWKELNLIELSDTFRLLLYKSSDRSNIISYLDVDKKTL